MLKNIYNLMNPLKNFNFQICSLNILFPTKKKIITFKL